VCGVWRSPHLNEHNNTHTHTQSEDRLTLCHERVDLVQESLEIVVSGNMKIKSRLFSFLSCLCHTLYESTVYVKTLSTFPLYLHHFTCTLYNTCIRGKNAHNRKSK
jgi:hypothetical protein